MQLLNLISMIIPAVFLILLLFGLFKWFAGLIFIIKNFKLFKYFFKKPFRVRDLVQIIVILALSLCLAFECFILVSAVHFSCPNPPASAEYRSVFKKAVSHINGIITLNYALTNSVPLENAEAFAQMIQKRTAESDTKITIIPQDKFKKYKITDADFGIYKDKPVLLGKDDIMYMFEKFEPGCKTADWENPDNSSCIMVIDVNGVKPPNKITEQFIRPLDRYKIIIDAAGYKIGAYPVHEVMRDLMYK